MFRQRVSNTIQKYNTGNMNTQRNNNQQSNNQRSGQNTLFKNPLETRSNMNETKNQNFSEALSFNTLLQLVDSQGLIGNKV